MGAYMTREGVAVLIHTDEPIRFSTLFEPLDLPPDEFQEGGVFLGLGNILDLPTTETLMDGTAQTATLTLGGLDPHLVNLIDAGSAEVQGVDITFGAITFDADYQVASVDWAQTFIIEKITLSTKRTGDETGAITHIQTLTVALGYGDGHRRCPTNIYWTNDQAGSGDLFFKNVPGLTSDVTRPFPPK